MYILLSELKDVLPLIVPIVLLFIFFIVIIILNAISRIKTKKKLHKTEISLTKTTQAYQKAEQKFQDIQQQYTTYVEKIEEKQTVEAEKAKRRRVKTNDKKEVLERDNYTCQICGISKGFIDSFCNGLGDYLLLEVDHIQSVSQGGTGENIDNLQCLCWRCNRKKGGKKTNEEVKNKIDYGISYLNADYSDKIGK